EENRGEESRRRLSSARMPQRGIAMTAATVNAGVVSAEQAARCLRDGGVIAYPTEAVWGLGCDPFDVMALERLLAIKQRPPDKGLIAIAADLDQLRPLLDLDALPPE